MIYDSFIQYFCKHTAVFNPSRCNYNIFIFVNKIDANVKRTYFPYHSLESNAYFVICIIVKKYMEFQQGTNLSPFDYCQIRY